MVTTYTERDLLNRALGQDLETGFITNKNVASTSITEVLGTLAGKGYDIKKFYLSTGTAKNFALYKGTSSGAVSLILGTLYGAANSLTNIDFILTKPLSVGSGEGLYIVCSAADACTVIVEGNQI